MSLGLLERRWLRIAGAAILIVPLVFLSVLMIVAAMMGWQLQIVRSGSMEPGLPSGSLAIVTTANVADIGPGEALVFRDRQAKSGRVVTHRVIRVVERPDGLFFETRGDANLVADPFLVPARDVLGVVQLHVPRLGDLLDTVRQPALLFLIAGSASALLFLDLLRGRRRHQRSISSAGDAVPG